MFRPAVVLAAVALVALPAPAQPFGYPGLRILDAKIEKGELTWNETQAVPVAKEVVVTVNINGMNVTEKRTVVTYESVTVKRATAVKDVKATDAAGKAIDADKLAELLKDATPVVVTTGALSDKHRALFKDKTVFVELPAPPLPKGPPGLQVLPMGPVPVVPPKM